MKKLWENGGIRFIIAVNVFTNILLMIVRVFWPSSLIVDQTIIIIIISALIAFLLRRNGTKKLNLNSANSQLFGSSLTIALMIFLCWVLLVPGCVERSRSLHIFQWITYGNSYHSERNLEIALTKTYQGFDVQGFKLRLHEHQVRGLLTRKNETIQLTFGGRLIYNAAKTTAWLYNLKGWYAVPLNSHSRI